MSIEPVDVFFSDSVTLAARLTTAAGVTDIRVILDESDQVRNVGEARYVDGGPSALCRAIDVVAAKKGDTIKIHKPLTTDLEQPLTDPNGDPYFLEAVESFVIDQVLREESGTAELIFTEAE